MKTDQTVQIPGCSESSLGAQVITLVLSCGGSVKGNVLYMHFFLLKYQCTQLFEATVKTTIAIFKQLKPCSNHGIHMLFEHGFYFEILKTERRMFT